MALSDDERKYWRTQADAGVKPAEIAASIKAQRGQSPTAPAAKPAETPAPATDAPAPVADPMTGLDVNDVGAAKDALAAPGKAARAVGKLGEGLSLDPTDNGNAAGAPRRQFLRGVSNATTMGLAQKAGEAIDQKFAASAAPDAVAAPGYETGGEVTSLALPAGAINGGIGKAAGAIARPVERVLRGAAGRMVGRAADDLGVGAGKAARRGLEAKADEIESALAERPALRRAAAIHASTGEAKPLAAEAKKLASDGSSEIDKIYAEAGKHGYRPPNYEPDTGGVPLGPESLTSTTRLPDPNWKPPARAPAEAPRQLATGKQSGLLEGDLDHDLTAPVKNEPMAEMVHGPGGVPADAVRSRLDARIGELAKGDNEERAVATQLKGIRDELHTNKLDGAETIHPKELRAEQSAYQKKGKYGLTAADAIASQANQEASEAVGDALLEHVTGMDYATAVKHAEENPGSLAARLLDANGKVTAAMRIDKAIAGRAGSNPGAPNRLTSLMHGMKHFGSIGAATAATGLGHGAIGAALLGADLAHSAAPHVARKLDPMIAKLVEQGTAEKWKPQKLAAAISRLASMGHEDEATQ